MLMRNTKATVESIPPDQVLRVSRIVPKGSKSIAVDVTWIVNGEGRSQRIPIVWASVHFGGLRPWLVCPVSPEGVECGRRCGRLFLVGGKLGCRKCHQLTYRSSQVAHRWERWLIRMEMAGGFSVISDEMLLRGFKLMFESRE